MATSKTTPKTTPAKSRTKAATSPRKTPAKTPAKSMAKPPAAAETPAVVVNAPTPVVSGPVMRKKELIDAVVTRSGIKKRDAKPVVEAMLEVLGAALQEGRELNLQPMGKVKVKREKKMAEGKVLVTRIRQARTLSARLAPADDGAENGSA